MILDIRTIFFILFLVSALLAFMLLVYWKTQKTYNGFSLWAWACLFVCLGYLFIMLRGDVPDLFSIVLANLLIAWSLLMRADGIRRFFVNQRLSPVIYTVLPVVLLLYLWFTYGAPSIVARSILLAAVMVPCLIYMGYLAIRSAGSQNRFINWTFGISLFGFSLMYTLRSLYWLAIPPADVFSGDGLNTLFLVMTLVMELSAVGLFLMLNMARAQRDIAASEERYRVLSDSLPDYVVVHDGSKILYANPATAAFLGYTGESIVGMSVISFIAPASQEESTKIIHAILSHADPGRSHEILIVTPDGKNHTCIVRSVPITFHDTSAVMSVLTDITERKLVEDALRTLNRKLNLLSGITRHDIKNQLMALGAYLQLGLEAAENPKEVREFLVKGEQITEVIGRQINFTKDYENLGVSSPVWQEVESLAGRAAAALPLRDIRLECQCSGIEIFADPLFEKVFYNLIDNSLRYGGETMTTIRVRCEDAPPGIRLIVQDDGMGIAAGDKPELFKKGFGKNTGLGLFFIREILSITGISITETGEPGKGARFEISVPEGVWRIPSRRQ